MAGKTGCFEITPDHVRWAKNHTSYCPENYIGKNKYQFFLDLIEDQKGLCKFSEARLLFRGIHGRPIRKLFGSHPLYASVDHLSPRDDSKGLCIVCYALNDMKGHLPYDCFRALQNTPAWQDLMEAWRKLAESNAKPDAFKSLIEMWPKGRPASPSRKFVQILVPETMTHVGGSSLESRTRTVKVDERSMVKALTTNDYHDNWYFPDPDSVKVLSVEDCLEDSPNTT
ncbi:MAG: hypothetical protein QUS11_02070 [Candidatus Fermentibacter sp.]|nr:hypothetical protein [Candidatus Fermentibacter sp.]